MTSNPAFYLSAFSALYAAYWAGRYFVSAAIGPVKRWVSYKGRNLGAIPKKRAKFASVLPRSLHFQLNQLVK